MCEVVVAAAWWWSSFCVWWVRIKGSPLRLSVTPLPKRPFLVVWMAVKFVHPSKRDYIRAMHYSSRGMSFSISGRSELSWDPEITLLFMAGFIFQFLSKIYQNLNTNLETSYIFKTNTYALLYLYTDR